MKYENGKEIVIYEGMRQYEKYLKNMELNKEKMMAMDLSSEKKRF